MQIIELIISDNEELNGIDAISLVENPAIEENFIALKDQALELAKVDDEKRILMGAALIPNKPIYRRSGENEFYIFFSKDTVNKASQLFLQNGNQGKATLEHEKAIQGLTVVESWIVEDETHDKSKKHGLSLPLGTWMVSMKVEDDAIWNDFVKTGKVKGFSIEGYFADKLERPNEKVKDNLKNNLKEMSAEEKLIKELQDIILGSQKVELGLIDDVEKKLDKANSELRSLKKQALSVADKLNDLQSSYATVFSISKKAENSAKELGADDIQKMFGSRGDEAKDFEKQVGSAANKIKSIITQIS